MNERFENERQARRRQGGDMFLLMKKMKMKTGTARRVYVRFNDHEMYTAH